MSSLLDIVKQKGINTMMAKPKMKLWIGILLYGAAIILQLFIMKMLELSTLAKVFVALLPMLPAIWLTKNILLVIRNYDELKKKIIYESVAFSLVVTTLITLSLGFLEEFVGLGKISMGWVWPIIGTNLIIGRFVTNRRYQ